MIFCLAPFVYENFVSQDRFGLSLASARSFSTLRLNHQSSIINHQSGANSRDSARFPRRRPLFIQPSDIGPVPRLSGQAIAYRWSSLPRVRWNRASKPQGSSSNGCCYFRFHHGATSMRLPSPTPTVGTLWACAVQNVSEAVYMCIATRKTSNKLGRGK